MKKSPSVKSVVTGPQEHLWIGVDVSSTRVDVHVLPLGTRAKFTLEAGENILDDPAGPAKLAAWILSLAATHQCTRLLCVLEPTGGYEQAWIEGLGMAKIPTALVPANRVRAHARASGQLAKTDSIDAKILADYGRLHRPRALPPPDRARALLRDLIERREQLVTQKTAENLRLQKARTSLARESHQRLLAFLEGELKTLEDQVDAHVESHPHLHSLVRLLKSAPGIGTFNACAVVAHLPELGTISPKEIAALAGVAPLNRDSGTQRGKRTIYGGRSSVRKTLFFAVISGLGCKADQPFKVFYRRLRDAGKPHKLATIAAARKLLTVLNAMARTNTPFNLEHCKNLLESHPIEPEKTTI